MTKYSKRSKISHKRPVRSRISDLDSSFGNDSDYYSETQGEQDLSNYVKQESFNAFKDEVKLMHEAITCDIVRLISEHEKFTAENLLLLAKIDKIDWSLLTKAEKLGTKQIQEF